MQCFVVVLVRGSKARGRAVCAATRHETDWRNYFDSTDGVVYVIDCADRRRLDECGVELAQLLEEERLGGVALLVLANKQDLLNAMPAAEVAEALGLFLIRDRPWQIQGCSAKEGFGIAEGFGWVVRQAR